MKVSITLSRFLGKCGLPGSCVGTQIPTKKPPKYEVAIVPTCHAEDPGSISSPFFFRVVLYYCCIFFSSIGTKPGSPAKYHKYLFQPFQ